jgi:predicted metal-dependent phosphotriesterase family hydrolase
MRLFGVGTGLGVVTSFGRVSDPTAASFQRGSTGARRLQFPRGAIIRTSVRDIDPNAITGATLIHEHLGTGRPGRAGGPPSTPGQDPDWMVEELKAAAKQGGVDCIVAAQTNLPGPDMLPYLKQISEQSGMHIVPAGGLYMLQSYSADIKTGTDDHVADLLVQAAAAGRIGVFGENGVTNNAADLAPEEKKVFRALGKAQARTGVPILTHNNYSTGPNVPRDIALRQLDLLEAGGATPQSCAIGHVCCLDDPTAQVSKQLAKRGAFIAFDRLSRQEQWVSDQQRAKTIVALIEAGYVDNLLFSSDYGGTINLSTGEKNSYTGPLHARDGGPGYARSLLLFLPKLRKAGVRDETIHKITVDNSRRFLSFVPKNS